MKDGWVLGNLSLVCCCALLLLFVSTPIKVSGVENVENNVLKVSEGLEATLSKLSPSDTLLIWLDVYIPPLPDGNIYLSSSDFSPITDMGVKIAGVTFSPNKEILWYLVEAYPAQVSNLANLQMVKNVSLARIGVWDWWNKNWRNEILVDPLLNMIMQRINEDFPDTKIPVVINYAKIEQNKTKENNPDVSGEIAGFVKSVGGEVVRTGIAEYIIAKIPPVSLSRLHENKHIRTLEANKPIYLRGGSFRNSASNSQNQLLILLLPMCVVCYSTRKPHKVKLALITSLLLATSLLLSYSMPQTYALSVSRPAIRADQTGNTGNGVVVAVIDTGIDFNHGDLANAILWADDLTGQNNPMDFDGHGTHVAGIVASRSGTFTGIAPGSQIISLKVDTPARIPDAIQWCIDNQTRFGIRIIQLSVGDTTESLGDGTDPLSMKADDAVEAGIAVVVAVMDSDTNSNGIYELSNPEQAFNVIAVGAVNDQNTVGIDDDTIAYYSAGGSTTDGRPKPDIVAPGGQTDDPFVGIWSTRSAQAPPGNYEAVNGVYGRMSGTSMAAPHVSGTVALMLEANPNLTPAQVKAILRQTANLTNNLNGDAYAGHGIIDAYAAVQLAQSVNNIDRNQMYDSYNVRGPDRRFDVIGKSADYLNFTVDAPSSTYGIAVSNVWYHFWDWWGLTLVDYTELSRISARHIWIDNTYYDLGTDMQKYLFSGPRIYEKSAGIGWANCSLRACYRVGNVMIAYVLQTTVEQIRLSLEYSGGSSWKTLTYIDARVWVPENYAYLRSTSETLYYERKITGASDIDIKNIDHNQHIKVSPSSSDSPTMWILKAGYTGNNPDNALNDEYIYNHDIIVYYQGISSNAGSWINRNSESLPTPNPPRYLRGDQWNQQIPSSYNILSGSLSSGSISSVASSDNNYLVFQSTTSGTRISDVEFVGTITSTVQTPAIEFLIEIKGSLALSNVYMTLYDYVHSRYATSGEDGYYAITVSTSDAQKVKDIAIAEEKYRDSSGNWKMEVKAIGSATTFTLSYDWVYYWSASAKLQDPQSSSFFASENLYGKTQIGIRVWRLSSSGTETEIGIAGTVKATAAIPSPDDYPTGDYSVYGTWNCSQTMLATTDCLVVRIYKYSGSSWSILSAFPCGKLMTEQLGATILNDATWTVHYYFHIVSDTSTVFRHGTTTYNSRIENLCWT